MSKIRFKLEELLWFQIMIKLIHLKNIFSKVYYDRIILNKGFKKNNFQAIWKELNAKKRFRISFYYQNYYLIKIKSNIVKKLLAKTAFFY